MCRNQIADRAGVTLLFGVVKACPTSDPYFDDATRALATLATQHTASRYGKCAVYDTVRYRTRSVRPEDAELGGC